MTPFGVYVHFPYCTTRCPYCDFAVHVRRRIPHERYAAFVARELDERLAWFPGRVANTAYFGGGTPGLWRPDQLGVVLAAIRELYRLPGDAEVTVEINPGETNEEHLAALRSIGVNRLSIGAQSFDDRSLAVLGRTHDAKVAKNAVVAARRAGFENISVDLMFGLPQQGRAALDRELEALLALDTEHLSLYSLTIEPRTAFATLVRDKALVMPDDERQAELYERARDRLSAAGYVQHEISSWARPGRHAQHNTLYWRQGEYLGVGASASSLRLIGDGSAMTGERFSNQRSVDRYFAATSSLVGELAHEGRIATHETLAPDALEREAVWLGLRLVEGIERVSHRHRFGHDVLDVPRTAASVAKLAAAGLLDLDEQKLKLTRRGVLLADRVGEELL